MWLYRALASLPLAGLALFYGFVLRARIQLGRWPAPYHPDPTDLGFHLHYWLVVLSCPFICASAVPLLALLVYPDRGIRPRRWWGWLALWVVGFVTTFVLARIDPGRCFEWFAD